MIETDISDRQFNAQLIDTYDMLTAIRRLAVKENAAETIKEIDRKINYIKLKLQPLELPED